MRNKKIFFLALLVSSILIGAPQDTPFKSQSKLEKLIEIHIRRDWPQASRVEVTQINTRVKVPERATLMQIHPRPALGAISFELAWEEKGETKNTFGTAILKVEEPVAIALKNINVGELLNEENTRFESREVSRFAKNGIFTNWNDLENKAARAFIRSGSVVNPTQVEIPAEIKRGEMVDLLFENPQLTIIARMKAMDTGRTGQWIRVENQNSKRMVRAKVIGMGKVALK